MFFKKLSSESGIYIIYGLLRTIKSKITEEKSVISKEESFRQLIILF